MSSKCTKCSTEYVFVNVRNIVKVFLCKLHINLAVEGRVPHATPPPPLFIKIRFMEQVMLRFENNIPRCGRSLHLYVLFITDQYQKKYWAGYIGR
jgi:hypothetical protein